MFTTEELYLKIPSSEDEQVVMEFRKEFLEENPYSHISGAGKLAETENYNEWLEKAIKDLSIETVPEGRVPSTQYLTFRKSDNKLVGMIQVRHNIETEHLLKYGGHIGDCVRPSERNKGYATKQISLALEECKKLGIEKVLITCKDWNKASARTIEKNGGVFENQITDAEGVVFNRYWITI